MVPELSPWWRRHVHADRRPLLLTRGRIKRAIRTWFEGEGFTEVETACLQVSPGNEAHLSAFRTELVGTDLSRSLLYLHTSPEFACKKLLAAGEEKIFTFAPVFRNREHGPLHHPEFTMLEWYRARAPLEDVVADCINIVRIAADVTGVANFGWRDLTCDPRTEAERITVAEAFLLHAHIDILATLRAGNPDQRALAEQAQTLGLKVSEDEEWSDLFSRILAGWVEPKLGSGHPTVIDDYPIVAAALARPKSGDPRLAERFELYASGVELANGFGELTDPTEQRRRFEAEMTMREARYGERYPIDEDLLAALPNMPPAVGVALGFDRLVMLATGASRIEQVLWTPLPDAH